MVSAGEFVAALRGADVGLCTGVPDSLLAPLCAWFQDHMSAEEHVIAANEGGAVALATGHYLGSGKVPLVYLQNSGLGNAVNPLLSLAHPDVYGVPMLLVVGWRGQPGARDAPQHLPQGRATQALLNALEIHHEIVDSSDIHGQIARLVRRSTRERGPVALLVPKGVFEASDSALSSPLPGLSREAAVGAVVHALGPRDVVVATTGKAARELHALRLRQGRPGRDFLVVGSMGHASQIALGLAMSRPDRRICCLDGDGALIMHMGALAIIGAKNPHNLLHVVLDNGVHDSVGGQPTASGTLDVCGLALASGYRRAVSVSGGTAVHDAVVDLVNGPCLLHVRVRAGARADLGRPSGAPSGQLDSFVRWLAQ
ncbi:MAG: phosphonopyruvate decarboxylase [Kiritimatiellia bacterium]|jgi:phosphonopyruvate decarboxylase